MYRSLDCCQKARPHIDPIGSQCQGRDQRTGISHSSRCQKWDLEFIGRTWKQNEIGHVVFSGMPPAFESIDTYGVAAYLLRLERMADRGAFVDHLDTRFVKHR
ncbi:hypothetical protein D3C72_2163550 [compost metagenome]